MATNPYRHRERRRWRSPSNTLLPLLLIGASGCGLLETEDRGAEEAVVDITGDTPVPLQLITSDAFVVALDPETLLETVQFARADTITLDSLPFSNPYAIAAFDRFLIRLSNPDSAVASVRMTVTVDGSVEYDQPATISEGGSLEFRFQINQFF